MKVLCVAEKPSIAKSLASILGSGDHVSSRPGKDKFCRNFDIRYNLPGQGWVDMTITSVRGHLTQLEFPESYRKWYGCDPVELLRAPVETSISDDAKLIAQNLRAEARGAQTLMIWTDCDREGEHIGGEVVRVCQKVNHRINVRRARFSAIIASQIHAACRDAGELDWRAAEAVDARIELDLRVGSALTRLQTLRMKDALPELQDHLLSYGPCQIPTLGFVVDQYDRVVNFVSEPFWHIVLTDKRREGHGLPVQTVDFKWRRGHLFQKPIVEILHGLCKADESATVVEVKSKPTKKFKPYPLTTVELQKSGSRLLRLPPKRILDVAEALYNRGFLSYPRTETDQFDKAFDFRSLLQKQTQDLEWGFYVQQLLDGQHERPRDGKKNDKAHPPIHPIAHANNLSGDEKAVYDYVTRRFLAGCSKDATGKLTSVEVELGGEAFSASGLVIHERNYLDVFPYDKWTGNILPPYQQGEEFKPHSCTMKEGSTSAPNLLTEADLVALMDKNGIGTDATIAEHINKIIQREYVIRQPQGKITYLLPSTLGQGLVDGYSRIDFEKSLSKPLLRRETEYRMNLICEGQRTKQETVEESIAEYRAVYMRARAHFQKLVAAVSERLHTLGNTAGASNAGASAARRERQPNPPRRQPRRDDTAYDDHGDDDGDAPPHPPPAPPRTGSATRNASNARQVTSGSTSRTAAGRNTASSSRVPLSEVDGPNAETPQCRCSEDAVQRTVVKEGPNQGRKFWTCAKGQADGCGFFDWVPAEVDGADGHSRPARRSPPQESMSSRQRANRGMATSSRLASNGSSAGTTGPLPGRRIPAATSSRTTPASTRRNLVTAANNRSAAALPSFSDDEDEDDFNFVDDAALDALEVAAEQQRATKAAQNDSAAIIDELLGASSQVETSTSDRNRRPGRHAVNGFAEEDEELAGDSSADRIDEYRAWFASLAEGDDGGEESGQAGSSALNGYRSSTGTSRGAQNCRRGHDDDDDDDEQDHRTGRNLSNRNHQSANGGGGGGGGGGACFNCGEEGHWSSKCPESRTNSYSRGAARGGRGRRGGSSSNSNNHAAAGRGAKRRVASGTRGRVPGRGRGRGGGASASATGSAKRRRS
ncbi:unnamed protein product [Jaminaea pallidilutea]